MGERRQAALIDIPDRRQSRSGFNFYLEGEHDMASVRKREWEYNGAKKSAWVVEYTDPATGKRKRFTPN